MYVTQNYINTFVFVPLIIIKTTTTIIYLFVFIYLFVRVRFELSVVIFIFIENSAPDNNSGADYKICTRHYITRRQFPLLQTEHLKKNVLLSSTPLSLQPTRDNTKMHNLSQQHYHTHHRENHTFVLSGFSHICGAELGSKKWGRPNQGFRQ